jgi:hypothetical protein
MRHTIWLTAVLAIGCANPGHDSAEAADGGAELELPQDMAGCYALYDENRLPASESLYFASDRIRLDTVARGRPRSWKATRLGGSGRVPPGEDEGRAVYWAADSLAADSIRIMIHNGFSGSELILGVRNARANRFHGRALEHWDIGPSTNDAGLVTAVRVPCRADAG